MISKAGHIFLFLSVVAGGILKAQSFYPNYNFKHLNVQNGLTENLVYHFLQDSRGYMWIGTHNGLSLYDGISTTNFLHSEQDTTSISGNFINSILEDSAGQIWIGNETGINRYNRADNSFSHFGIDRPDGSKESTYCVLLGFIAANELWFLETETRSVRSLNIKTKNTSFVAELNASHAHLYKGSGNTIHIWSAYDKGTIHQSYKKRRLIDQQTYFSGKNDAFNYPELEVNHILQQNDTIVWLSTNEGLVKLNPVTHKYHIFKEWKKQRVKELRYTALSATGELWVASGPAGVYLFDIGTNQFTDNFRNNKLNPYSLCSDNIVSLYFDKTGNVWCGSFGSGSSYANTENIFFSSHISKDEMKTWGGNNNISWLGTDPHGNLLFKLTNVSGLWMLDKNLNIRMHKDALLENGASFNGYTYKLLFETADEAWCTTSKGLYIYNVRTNRMRPVKYELISGEVQGSIWIIDIMRLKDSSILFSTYAGIYHLTKESGKPLIKPVTFLKPGEYNGFGPLFEDEANLVYVKSLGDFLYILKRSGDGKRYELFKKIYFMPEINQYFHNKGDSIIYFATNDGLYYINVNTYRIEKETFKNKLSFRNIINVLKKDDQFWIFGEKGLFFFNEKTNESCIYTVEDGLPSNEFKLSQLVLYPDGRCIAGSANGLVSFFPNQQQSSIYPPRPSLANIYINDVLYSPTQNPNEKQIINLSYRQNTFSFDFAPISFYHATECRFEYKLDPYDETWIKSGDANYTRYSKIPPGNYVFNLRVIDAMGRVSPFTKTIGIQIGRAFWQTTLFKIAAGILLLLIGWLVSKWYFRYKIRKQKMEFEKLQAIEKERTRIATDMHDDLGAGLSRIKFLSQSLGNKDTNDESIKYALEKITGYSDEMTEKMGEIVWALNEKNDTLADLVAYTRAYAMEYLANHNIQCEANTPLHLPGTFIPGEMRRNIFLAVKECLHNIVKHAHASQVYFSVELNGAIQIIIHDNGIGIDWNNRRPYSNGLENIQKRMNEIKGKADFSNKQGTKVLLIVPLNL